MASRQLAQGPLIVEPVIARSARSDSALGLHPARHRAPVRDPWLRDRRHRADASLTAGYPTVVEARITSALASFRGSFSASVVALRLYNRSANRPRACAHRDLLIIGAALKPRHQSASYLLPH